MTRNLQFLTTFLIFVVFLFSCKKEKEEPLKPYDFAQGVWYFDSECPDAPFPGIEEILPSNVNIEGEGNDSLSLTIESPIGDSVIVFGIIDNDGNVNVAEQALFSIDTNIAGFPVTAPVLVSGNGQITSPDLGNLVLNYSANAGGLFELFNFTCTVDLFRAEEGEEPGE